MIAKNHEKNFKEGIVDELQNEFFDYFTYNDISLFCDFICQL